MHPHLSEHKILKLFSRKLNTIPIIFYLCFDTVSTVRIMNVETSHAGFYCIHLCKSLHPLVCQVLELALQHSDVGFSIEYVVDNISNIKEVLISLKC